MALKMKELVEKSKEAKSTILYYIKEGLLPEPQKPKPNVHLYDESCVDRIKFIKYLQSTYNYSISEIKELFKNSNIDKNEPFFMMVRALELANITKSGKFLTQEEFMKKADISKELLQEYIDKGYIYKRKEGFGEKEVEIVLIIKRLRALNLGHLINSYVKSAKEIAQIEMEVWSKLFEDNKSDTILEHKLSFDTTLKLKPYIYNIHTLQKYYQIKEEQK
jgi:DNA-binding transcriptional MerR regulator